MEMKSIILKTVPEIEIPYLDELYYFKDLTWMKIDPDGHARIGLTDIGQKLIGPIVLIRLRHEGKILSQGEMFGRFHGSKIWYGPFKSPVSGKIVEVNQSVVENPDIVNRDPYGDGWLIRVNAKNLDKELKTLYRGEKAVSKMFTELVEERKRKPAFFW